MYGSQYLLDDTNLAAQDIISCRLLLDYMVDMCMLVMRTSQWYILALCVVYSVHGFERTVVSVDEGAAQETLVVRMDIKGNTLLRFRVTVIDLTLRCQDVTTGE